MIEHHKRVDTKNRNPQTPKKSQTPKKETGETPKTETGETLKKSPFIQTDATGNPD